MDKPNYLEIAGNIFLSYYVEAADELGIDYEIIRHKLCARFQSGNKHWFICNASVPINPATSCAVAKRKDLTTKVLDMAGLPVAKQLHLATAEDALSFWEDNNRSIVIKPNNGIGGKAVAILPSNEDEVREAFQTAFEAYKTSSELKVIGEEFVTGENYRVLVLDSKVIGVVRRVPAYVTGDGQSTVQQLVEATNAKRKERFLKPIKLDLESTKALKALGMTLGSVPSQDERVMLRFNSNLTTGGSTEECASELHPYYADICVKAAQAVGLKLCGVDLIAEDITNPGAKAVINELNHDPGFRIHYLVDKGDVVKVAKPVMEYIRDVWAG